MADSPYSPEASEAEAAGDDRGNEESFEGQPAEDLPDLPAGPFAQAMPFNDVWYAPANSAWRPTIRVPFIALFQSKILWASWAFSCNSHPFPAASSWIVSSKQRKGMPKRPQKRLCVTLRMSS
jgi:hypothetical protein